MNYIIYIGERCHQCEEVLQFMEKTDVNYRVINIDQSVETPPIDLFAFPALFQNDKLLCYGSDIEEYFS